jgi:hypothetical protein
MPQKTSSRDVGLDLGFRSGLEEAVSEELTLKNIRFKYESFTVPYSQPEKPRKYTPDYLLFNGIIIETKGRFVTADRQKHLLVKMQYPDLDIRFVFSNPNQRIGKKSKTTYAMWCESKGFKYAKVHVPDEWLIEPVNAASLARAKSLMKEKKTT